MTASTPGMAEYQADLREYPRYSDGRGRPAWEDLPDSTKAEWEKYARIQYMCLAAMRGEVSP